MYFNALVRVQRDQCSEGVKNSSMHRSSHWSTDQNMGAHLRTAEHTHSTALDGKERWPPTHPSGAPPDIRATRSSHHDHHLLSLSAMKWRCHNCPLGDLSRESRLKRFLWLKKMISNYLVPNSKLAQGHISNVYSFWQPLNWYEEKSTSELGRKELRRHDGFLQPTGIIHPPQIGGSSLLSSLDPAQRDLD